MAGDNTLELVPGEEYVEIDLPEGMVLPEQAAADLPPVSASPPSTSRPPAMTQMRSETYRTSPISWLMNR